jgi:O-antigen ligase
MIRRTTRLLGWLAFAICCLLPLWWFALVLPHSMQLALVLYAVLALLRPFDALMIFAGLGPVVGGLVPLAGTPYDGGSLMEAMILALLAGAAGRVAVRRDSIELTDFEWALLAFTALVVASCMAQWPVTMLRAGVSEPLSASSALLLRGYFNRPVELTPILQTIQLLEGIGLAAFTARLVTADRAMWLAGAVVTGAAGAAALNVQRVLEVALRQPSFPLSIIRSLRTLRVSTQYGDVNAAGSYFAMTAVMCLPLTRRGSGRRSLALAVLPVISAGLWLAGSRVALTAAILCGAWVLALNHRARALRVRGRQAAVLTAVLVLLGGIVAGLFISPPVGQTRFGYAVFTRTELLKTGLRMVADRPVFGVGISQFYQLFPRYSSMELRHAFATEPAVPVTHENAHNNLMQILAELGIAGLTAFVLVLATALRRGAEGEPPLWRLAALSGLTAFLLTCLGGHPLLTPMVAFPFWLALGLAASGAAPLNALRRTYLRRLIVTAVVVLLVTLPVRAGYERREADLGGAGIGFSKWERDEEGNRFRAAGERSAFFVASSSRFVRIPLRSPDTRQRRVQLRLDGRQVSEVLVPPGMWFETRLVLPPDRDGPKFRRVDIIAKPDDAGDPLTPDRAILVGRPSEAPGQE